MPFPSEKEGRVRFRGIVEIAKKLGVSRTHLYLVLSGRRESRSLRERYAQICVINKSRNMSQKNPSATIFKTKTGDTEL